MSQTDIRRKASIDIAYPWASTVALSFDGKMKLPDFKMSRTKRWVNAFYSKKIRNLPIRNLSAISIARTFRRELVHFRGKVPITLLLMKLCYWRPLQKSSHSMFRQIYCLKVNNHCGVPTLESAPRNGYFKFLWSVPVVGPVWLVRPSDNQEGCT